MRFFRTADYSLYESVRLQLDAAWGHPTEDGSTLTCFDAIENAPKDSAGRVLLGVDDAFAMYEPAATIIPQLLESGAIEEITADEYIPHIPNTKSV